MVVSDKFKIAENYLDKINVKDKPSLSVQKKDNPLLPVAAFAVLFGNRGLICLFLALAFFYEAVTVGIEQSL